MNEVDSSNLPTIRTAKKRGRKAVSGRPRSAYATKYRAKKLLRELSTEKTPPSKRI